MIRKIFFGAMCMVIVAMISADVLAPEAAAAAAVVVVAAEVGRRRRSQLQRGRRREPQPVDESRAVDAATGCCAPGHGASGAPTGESFLRRLAQCVGRRWRPTNRRSGQRRYGRRRGRRRGSWSRRVVGPTTNARPAQ